MLTTLRYALVQFRGQILGWGLGVAALGLILVPFYDVFMEQQADPAELLVHGADPMPLLGVALVEHRQVAQHTEVTALHRPADHDRRALMALEYGHRPVGVGLEAAHGAVGPDPGEAAARVVDSSGIEVAAASSVTPMMAPGSLTTRDEFSATTSTAASKRTSGGAISRVTRCTTTLLISAFGITQVGSRTSSANVSS